MGPGFGGRAEAVSDGSESDGGWENRRAVADRAGTRAEAVDRAVRHAGACCSGESRKPGQPGNPVEHGDPGQPGQPTQSRESAEPAWFGEPSQMTVGVPKEVKDHETRVGLVPSGATALREAGHRVLVETQRRRWQLHHRQRIRRRGRGDSAERGGGLAEGRSGGEGEGAAAQPSTPTSARD